MSCQLLHLDEMRRTSSLSAVSPHRIIRQIWAAKRFLVYFAKTIAKATFRRPTHVATSAAAREFKAGDLVRVRSKSEIDGTLDAWCQHKGCTFIPEMYRYCGQTFRVLKQVEYFYDEVKRKSCKCRGVVFLEGVACSGERKAFPRPCDRNCFIFWRTAWLEKIDDDG